MSLSRIANQPVSLPSGVTVTVNAGRVSVKGSKGELHHQLHTLVKMTQVDNTLTFAPVDSSKEANMHAGTARALLNNMVAGVNKGFEKKLTLIGVGYRAKVSGKLVEMTLGFSHPVKHPLPEGVTAETPSQTEIVVRGCDKQKVGQVAADLRAYRPPEPYKGKGVRYADEQISLKETKKK